MRATLLRAMPKQQPKPRTRCTWATAELMWDYHDREWGVPVHDDRTHFEFLVLEGAQAGLSWSTILAKRGGYRAAFAAFDPDAVARFDARRIAKLLEKRIGDHNEQPTIVRNRLKVESVVSNARAFVKLRDELGSFDDYIWGFVDGAPIVNRWTTSTQIPATSPQSDALAADLKRRGFKFAGSTIMYAHMQACGLVNDHVTSCWRWREVAANTLPSAKRSRARRRRSAT
jgi:DNA-3-methyladenine glycosylase I